MYDLRVVNGILLVNGTPVVINELIFEQELSRGASGVVFKGRDPILHRQVAVKLWLTLRAGDKQDKRQQGIAESRKA